MLSNTLNRNDNYIKDAINEGIMSDAVKETLTDMLNKSDELRKSPTQIRKTLRFIAGMKREKSDTLNREYVSNLVSTNSEKIKSALNDGISPEEISTSLIGLVNNNNHNLKFLVKLITRMKKKEMKLKLNNQNTLENAKQKVLTLK